MSDDDAHLLTALQRANTRLTGQPRSSGLEASMREVLAAAVDTVQSAAAVGISLETGTTIGAAYSTGQDVHDLDALQGDLRQGPCVTAAEASDPDHAMVVARDLEQGEDRARWPLFAQEATAAGYRSVVSVQLSGDPGQRSALNFYSRRADAFDRRDTILASLFALQASSHLAGLREADRLRRALEIRDLLGQVKGVLIERFTIDEDQAFEMLARCARDVNVSLLEAARRILADAQLPDGDAVASDEPGRPETQRRAEYEPRGDGPSTGSPAVPTDA